ncbi:MAG: translocation/assembly module TamB domain-containing protein [Burkholderiales bacterium]|nr:translocation/assembly module TamB domain-containing protein [Burkholderiales bacterium]
MARYFASWTWRRALAAGVLLLACAVSAAVWMAGTETALRWTADRAVQASAGRLTLEEVHGSLYGEIRIGRFALEEGERRIDGQKLTLAWSPTALLFARTLRIDKLALQVLSLDGGKPTGEPPQLPQTLRLPLRLEIRDASVDTLAIVSAGNRHELRALTFSLENPSGQYRALASAETRWGKGDTELTLADAPPFGLNARVGLSRDDAAHTYQASAKLTGTLADIEVTATASAREARAELRAALAPLAMTPLKHAKLNVTGIDARKFQAGLPRTELSAELDLRSSGDNSYAGNLKLENALPGTIDASRAPLRAAQLSFDGSPEALELKDVRLEFGNAGRFEGAGSLQSGRLNLALETSALDLRGVYAKLAASSLSGKLKLDAQSAAQEVQADLRQNGHRLRIDALRRGDTVQVREARVSIAGGEFDFSGEMSLARSREFRASGRLAGFDPSKLGDYPAALINGSVSASGHLSPKPEAALEFSTDDSRYRGHRLHGGGKVRVSGERVWDSDIALDLGANHLSARGAFGAPGDVMDWRLEGNDLAAFAAQLRGELRATGRLSGSVAEPSGTFRALARNLVWAKDQHVGEFTAEGSIDDGIDGKIKLAATLTDYRAPALQLTSAALKASGLRGDHSIELSARNAAIDARAVLAGAWNADRNWSGRILSFDNRGRYAATLEAPANLTIRGADFSLVAAGLRFANGSVRVEELARRENGIFSAGTLTGIDSGYLLGLMKHPLDVSSKLTLGGSWRLAAADKINGEFEIRREQGDLVVLSEPVTALGLSNLAIKATLSDDQLSATFGAAGSVFGTIAGRMSSTLARQGAAVGLPGDAPLSFEAELDMPTLAWATSLLGGKTAIDGRLKGKFGGQGSVARPQLNGEIKGDGLIFDNPEQGIYLRNGSLRAHLKDNILIMDQFVLDGGGGKLAGEGSVKWEAGKASARIALNADKLEIVKRLDRHLILSGDANATLQDKHVMLAAKLKADKGEIALPDADTPTLSTDVVVLGRDGEAERRSPPIAGDAVLDLDLGDNFHLRGRGIDARLAGAVTVRATDGAPATASGSIRVAKGSYSAYGQRLAIDRGILNFAGPLDNPGLNIVATRKQLPVEAGVAIQGTALAPQISLVSTPSVADSEKLSWLVLGRGMDEANKTDLALLQTAAGALLGRGESVMLQDRIAHAAGLDEVAVRGAGGLESTVLALGKRLSTKAYMTFEQGLTTATHLMKISYTLTPRLSVRAETGSDSAVDAFYTFRFK